MDSQSKQTKWPQPLANSFYRRPADRVARALIGKSLLRRCDDQVIGGIIVETEAYLASDDPACHAARGETRRNHTMFGPAGRMYVYTIHAKFCLNAVTQREGLASAVLIRAIEPIWGIDGMQQRRGQMERLRLCRGPSMLCQALAIDLRHDGICLTQADQIWIGRGTRRVDRNQIVAAPRIGISQATDLPLRYFVRNNPYVSGPKYWHQTDLQ